MIEYENSSSIAAVEGRIILDSRSKETVEVKVTTEDGFMGIDAVPSGTSTGKAEVALVDPQKAVENINAVIAPKLIGLDVTHHEEVDQLMIALDGTENKEKLGGNATLGVSLAVARTAALAQKMPLYWYLNKYFNQLVDLQIEPKLPKPMMVMFCGGKHGGGKLCAQEFLVETSVENGKKIWYRLEEMLKERNLKFSLGLEGAFSPDINKDEEALTMIQKAVEDLKLNDVRLGLDIAGNNCKKTKEEIIKLAKEFRLATIEDPFGEDDWPAFQDLTDTLSDQIIIGDDLFATHKNLLAQGISEKAANGIIIKVNQIGTLSEALEVVGLAKKNNIKVIVSHRSGETTDAFIADLAVAVGADFLKSGAPIPKERLLKYKRLEEIAKEL